MDHFQPTTRAHEQAGALRCATIGHTWFDTDSNWATVRGIPFTCRCERCGRERRDILDNDGNVVPNGRTYWPRKPYLTYAKGQRPSRADFRRMLLTQRLSEVREDAQDEEEGVMTVKELALLYTCPDCGKQFDKHQALNGHRMAHRAVPPCPECGEKLNTAASMARHRAKLHNVPLKSSGSTEPRSTRRADLSDWEADDILVTIIDAMFPTGTLPNKAVIPLIHWREATRQLIEALQTQT